MNLKQKIIKMIKKRSPEGKGRGNSSLTGGSIDPPEGFGAAGKEKNGANPSNCGARGPRRRGAGAGVIREPPSRQGERGDGPGGRDTAPAGVTAASPVYLGLGQLALEEVQGFGVAPLALLQPLELLPQLPLEKKTSRQKGAPGPAWGDGWTHRWTGGAVGTEGQEPTLE